MTSEQPTHFVIFGSESDALIDFVNSIEKSCKIVRIYNHQVPTPRENCIDISDLTFLEKILKNLDSSPEIRIAFIGVASRSQASLFVREKLEDLLGIVDTNVNAYVRLLHVLLPQMIKYKYGRLVYLSSFRSEHIGRGTSVYSASKSFCENLFRSIGNELGSFNIVSTTIRMGFFEGRMFDSLPKEMIARCLQQVSLRRKGRSSELSKAIWFAIENEYTNGGVIELDGGIVYDW